MDIDLAGPAHGDRSRSSGDAIEGDALASGSRRYHMGESGESDGIAGFKEKFGAQPVDHHEYRFERLPLTSAVDVASARSSARSDSATDDRRSLRRP